MRKVEDKNKEKLIEELEALRRRVAEEEPLTLYHNLRERVKELTCLHGVTQLMAKPGVSLVEVFNGVVYFVKNAWQYPEITCARIIFGGKEFKTDNFRSTEWKQSSDIKLNGETMGALEVYYLEEKPGADEGLFLKEERNLMEDIAKELGNFAERKRIERELREHRNHLEELIEKRTNEISNANEQLRVQMEQRIEFTRALVHEIKTPLTSVMAAGEILATELRQEPYQKLARYLYDGANELNDRIDELLDLAKGEVGILKLECTTVDLQKMLKELNQWLELQVQSRKQHLVLDISSSLSLLRADERRLRQILLNLLDNALKFTPNGGRITLRVFKKGKDVVFEVEDTGTGMTEEEQQHVFQAYYRTERDRERFSGLGLGLALSKNLVELHKGRIWINSQKDIGSTFSFFIPLQDKGALANQDKRGEGL